MTPSSRASRATSSHRAARLGVEARRRLVEEEHARPVHERERQVEPALHPAGVAADLAIGRLGQADALEQLVARDCRSRRGRPLQRRLQAEVVAARQHGSSAASCSAAPIIERTAGPSRTTS